MANKAAWLTAAQARPLQVDDAPMPEPGPHQLIVKTKAIALNPVDAIIQNAGILIQEYPTILGEDIAGEVISIGNDVHQFNVGDRVTALAADLDMEKGAFSGTFQLYCRVNDDLAAKIPDNVTYSEAAVLPVALCTAVDSLFLDQNLRLPYPKQQPTPTGSVLLVWGGSSSVGSCAIQLARASGLEVVTTSSEPNFTYCRDLGAKWVFDYKSSTVEDDIVKAFEGKQCAGIFDAVSVMDPESVRSCANIAGRLSGNTFVATVHVPGQPLPEGLPSDVKFGFNYCTRVRGELASSAVWEQWLSPALASRLMKCMPEPYTVGHGLESLQSALDLMAKGVSARKLVVEL